MKVLHIVGDSKFGGASVLILRLAEKARSVGFDVDVLTTDPTFKTLLTKKGIKVIELNAIKREINPIYDLVGLFRLYKFLRNKDYDIIHTHTSKGGFIGRLAAKLARIPVIIHTVHGFAFHEQSSVLATHFYAFLERLASNWCDKIVTVSRFHRERALKLKIGNKDKVIAIPNGISEERVKPSKPVEEVRSNLGISSDEILILTTGRLAPQKGLEYLIKAIPHLSTYLPDTKFKVLIVGEGPLREELEKMSKSLGVHDKILFLGFRNDVANFLGASDIVVLPSLWEGLSIALLEAMAAGKPIVTTTIGSNLEVLENGVNAILVPPKNPEALAEALAQLLKNAELRTQIAKNAQRTYRERYTEERMLKEYMELYNELCHKQKDN